MAGRTEGDAAEENGPEEKSVDLMCPINYKKTIPIKPYDLKLLPIQYNKESNVEKVKLTNDVSTEHIQFQPQTIEKVDVKAGFNIKNNFKKGNINIDKESQLKAIEKTFKTSKRIPTKHPSKPNVYAVETLEVFPDFKNWKYPCAQVIFDSNPAPVDKSKPTQLEMMSQAMLRGFIDEHGDHVVGYFLPSEETMCKRLEDVAENRHYDDDYQYKYKMAEKYYWNAKNKSDIGSEKNYFLTIGPNGVFYNEFETTVHLKKRSPKFAAESSNNKLILNIQHVPPGEGELCTYKLREEYLQPCDKEKELDFAEDANTLTFCHHKNASDGHVTIDNKKFVKNECANGNTKYGNNESSSDLESDGSCEYNTSVLSTNDDESIFEEDFSF